jgi:hypothetical protein
VPSIDCLSNICDNSTGVEYRHILGFLFACHLHFENATIEYRIILKNHISVPSEKHPAVVQEIIRLIGYESPTEAISRLWAAYKAEHACTSCPNEILDKFTVRYRGLASNDLDLANVSFSCQNSQLLATVLLGNAQLISDSLQGETFQPVQQAQQFATLGFYQSSPAYKQCIKKCTQTLRKLPDMFPKVSFRLGRD